MNQELKSIITTLHITLLTDWPVEKVYLWIERSMHSKDVRQLSCFMDELSFHCIEHKNMISYKTIHDAVSEIVDNLKDLIDSLDRYADKEKKQLKDNVQKAGEDMKVLIVVRIQELGGKIK